ncbi:MAG TPA: ThiF family adenylyltransferase [Actinocrinis sp.]|jgi:tRNA A37 threonylcarbamoyladenosine dehydratase|uniref:ThiF family adenylyltransferase n=1 Tax=Actinocrinis sp. TaxID=1920516 RepID=UPI002DDD8F5E|nr:ThiF family adenylyltransferase [Actinocrinis sp.]HEV3170334.1 ThiF family adenylyltransferase [Actinocrinis sp.]
MPGQGVDPAAGQPHRTGVRVHPAWHDAMRGARVAVVGVGSVSATAADALASYGIGTLSLVDPDHLPSRNLIRHPLTARDLGRFKVAGLAAPLLRLAGSDEEHSELDALSGSRG